MMMIALDNIFSYCIIFHLIVLYIKILSFFFIVVAMMMTICIVFIFFFLTHSVCLYPQLLTLTIFIIEEFNDLYYICS